LITSLFKKSLLIFIFVRIVLLFLLGSLGCQGAAIIGSPLANQLKDRTQFSIERPSVKDQEFPKSQENKTASTRILQANTTTHPASTSTAGPYSAKTTAAPHAAAPTPASYPRPLIPTDASASYPVKPVLLTPIASITPDFYPRTLIPLNTYQPAPYAAPSTAPASYAGHPLQAPTAPEFYPRSLNPASYQPSPYGAPIPITPIFYPRPPNQGTYQPAPYAAPTAPAPYAAQSLQAPTPGFYPIPLNPINTNQPAPRAAPTAPASDDVERPLMVDLSISFPKSSGFRNLTAYLHCSDDCLSSKSWLPALLDWMQ